MLSEQKVCNKTILLHLVGFYSTINRYLEEDLHVFQRQKYRREIFYYLSGKCFKQYLNVFLTVHHELTIH